MNDVHKLLEDLSDLLDSIEWSGDVRRQGVTIGAPLSSDEGVMICPCCEANWDYELHEDDCKLRLLKSKLSEIVDPP